MTGQRQFCIEVSRRKKNLLSVQCVFIAVYNPITRPVSVNEKTRLTLTRVLKTCTEVQISAGTHNRNVEKYVRVTGCGRYHV